MSVNNALIVLKEAVATAAIVFKLSRLGLAAKNFNWHMLIHRRERESFGENVRTFWTSHSPRPFKGRVSIFELSTTLVYLYTETSKKQDFWIQDWTELNLNKHEAPTYLFFTDREYLLSLLVSFALC